LRLQLVLLPALVSLPQYVWRILSAGEELQFVPGTQKKMMKPKFNQQEAHNKPAGNLRILQAQLFDL
jgi:hypothetical protein